jgi:hypothetical protein
MDAQLGLDQGTIDACGNVSRILEGMEIYVLEITSKGYPAVLSEYDVYPEGGR